MGSLTESQARAMKRVGIVVAAIGLLEIFSWVMSAYHRQGFSVGWKTLALIDGILIFQGNITAARYTLYGVSFVLGALLLTPAMIFVFPLQFLWFIFRKAPEAVFFVFVFFIAFTALAGWIRAKLSSLPLYSGEQSGPPLFRSKAGVSGAAISLLMAVLFYFLMNSGSAERAKAEARLQVGPGYSFVVIGMSSIGKHREATVIAYSETEMREIEAKWENE